MKKKIALLLSLIIILSSLFFLFRYVFFQKTLCIEEIETQSILIDGVINTTNKNKLFSGANLCTYPQGEKKSMGSIKNGLKTGAWTYWHQSGQIRFERNYNQDLVIREKTYQKGEISSDISYSYYKNGAINSKQSFKNGLVNGKWVKFYVNGEIKSEKNYKNDKLEGEWIEWHPNGEKALKANYKNDKLDGKWIKWPILPQILFNGFYDWEGEPGEFRWADNSETNITLYNYADSVQTINISFILGTLVERGISLKFNDQPIDQFQMSSVKQIEYSYILPLSIGENILKFETNELGVDPDGEDNRILLFSLGQFASELDELKSEKNYIGNELNGKWLEFYANGEIKSEKNYIGNELNGKWSEFYSNGEIKSEKNYVNNRLNGKLTQWHSNGKKISEEYYLDGTCQSNSCLMTQIKK